MGARRGGARTAAAPLHGRRQAQAASAAPAARAGAKRSAGGKRSARAGVRATTCSMTTPRLAQTQRGAEGRARVMTSHNLRTRESNNEGPRGSSAPKAVAGSSAAARSDARHCAWVRPAPAAMSCGAAAAAAAHRAVCAGAAMRRADSERSVHRHRVNKFCIWIVSLGHAALGALRAARQRASAHFSRAVTAAAATSGIASCTAMSRVASRVS